MVTIRGLLLVATGIVVFAWFYGPFSPSQEERVTGGTVSAVPRHPISLYKGKNQVASRHEVNSEERLASEASVFPEDPFVQEYPWDASVAKIPITRVTGTLVEDSAGDDEEPVSTSMYDVVERVAEAGEGDGRPLSNLDPEALVQAYELVLNEHPGDVVLFQSLANDYLEAGDSDKALDLLQQGVLANPTNPEFHLHYGNLLRRFERYDEAADAYRSVLVYDMENAEAQNNLGEMYTVLGNDDLAQEYREEAKRLWARGTGTAGDQME